MECEPDGSLRRTIGINRDVTDQVDYEQLLQDTNVVLERRVVERTAELRSALANLRRANQLKDEFMAMISHELRTPLTGVLSMSEMLEDQIAGPLNARQASYVKGIVQSGERLLNVITADATAIAEVLKRLLDTAVKFTPDDGRIGLEAQPGTTPNTVNLVVWDTGIGIPANQFEHIFRAFVQADGTLSRVHEGLGLGLAYVAQMVHLMGGTIALESTPGVGSRFTITLPAGLRTA